MRLIAWWVIGAAVLFFAGAAVAFVGIERETSELAWLSLIGFLGAVLSLVVAGWRASRRVDWHRIEAEQALWESGALGRAWLAIRRRFPGQ